MLQALLQRFAVAFDRAQMSVANDIEASQHYGLKHSRLWGARCWSLGFIEGLFLNRKPLVPYREEALAAEQREWAHERF